MKKLLLILSLSLGLASPAFALDAAKVLEKGTVIHKESQKGFHEAEERIYFDFVLLVAYQSVLYRCTINGKNGIVQCSSYLDAGAN